MSNVMQIMAKDRGPTHKITIVEAPPTTVDGIPFKVRLAVCSRSARYDIEERCRENDRFLGILVAAHHLYEDGEGDVFILFVEQDVNHVTEVFGAVHGSNRSGSPTHAWTSSKKREVTSQYLEELNAIRKSSLN